MNRSTALGALGVVAATALVGGATVPPAVAAPATCFGKRATITGHGLVVGTEGGRHRGEPAVNSARTWW